MEEVLKRLMELNQVLYAREVKLGLWNKKKSVGKKKDVERTDGSVQGEMF